MSADTSSGPFTDLSAVARERLGLNLDRGGLTRTLQEFAAGRASSLLALHAKPESSPEFQELVDAVTVQHTWLFRDAQQLEVACSAVARTAPRDGRYRLWVPACATGEDAYSLAAVFAVRRLPVEILATDIHFKALQTAERGACSVASARHVPEQYRWILDASNSVTRIADPLRRSVRFAQQNLVQAAPRSSAADGRWDLILCRNVLIYFTPDHVARVLTALAGALAPEGTLVLGASDILTELPSGLAANVAEGRLVFTRAGAPPAPTPRRAPEASLAEAPIVSLGPAARATSLVPPPSAEAAPDEAGAERDAAVQHLTDGIARHLAGDLVAAARELRTSLYLMPELWPAAYYLALTYDGLGRLDEARRAYAQVVEQIEGGEPLPAIDGHDFTFLRRDVASIARRRAAGPGPHAVRKGGGRG